MLTGRLRINLTLGLSAGALLTAWGCGADTDIKKPQAPDLSETVQAFEAPSGTLDEATLASLIDSALERFDVSGRLGNLDFIRDIIGAAGGEGSETQELRALDGDLDTRRQPISIGDTTIDGEGFLTVKSVCRGWEGSDTPDPDTNGALGLTIGFSDTGLDPVIWGGFNRCRLKFGEVNAELNPKLIMHVGQNFQFGDAQGSPIVFDLADGRIVLDGEEFDFPLAFRVGPEIGLELLLNSDSGPLVFVNDPDAQTGALTIRDADGTWTCTLEEARCERDDGTTLEF